jgi:pyruvate dehydrogenase E2 component (dihydrolipoamide acetyltransferase)
VRSLTLIGSGGLSDEIDAEYVDGFVPAISRRELKPVLQRLFADPDQVSRQMVDEVLRYKRRDGVQDALRALADSLFAAAPSTSGSTSTGSTCPCSSCRAGTTG